MRNCRVAVAGFFAVLAVLAVAAPGPGSAEVSVNINIGPPAIVVPAPPEMIPVPRTLVYFAPGVDAELLFFRGYWWTPKEGRWFRARAYNGPWVIVERRHVPADIVRLPGDYRNVYVRGERVPYGQLKKHWEHRDRDRRQRVGEWKEEKHERKEREKELHREMKEERKDHRGKGHGKDD